MFRKLGLASFSAAVLALACGAQMAYGQAADTGFSVRAARPQTIDESQRVALGGNTHPHANAANDRGAVADDFPMEHMLLQLRRSPQQEQALEKFIEELHAPDSPNFHQWITAQEFGERFGLAQEDIDAVTNWLKSHGFRVNVVYGNRMLIDFSGTAGQVREAFQAEIHNLDVKGEKHIANMSDPRIPAALGAVVSGVVSLHDFHPHPMHTMRNTHSEFSFPDGLGGTTYAMVPADLATIYNLNPLFSAGYSGQGQTIALIEDTDVFTAADWTTFRSTFGLSGYTGASFTSVHPAPPSGPNNCGAPGVISPDDAEAILDAEWASASAPSAAIMMASCANTGTTGLTFGGLIAFQNLINGSSQTPAIISISYGECEAVNGAAANAAYSSAYQQAVTEGVSVFVAAGDSGAAGCDNNVAAATSGIAVSAFASTPYNVAVGGTDFSDTYSGTNSTYWSPTNTATFGSALSYVPEIPWNDSCAGMLLSSKEGFATPYGPSGACNDPLYGALGSTTVAGGGGPSGCATGTPSITGVVSGSCQGWAKPSWQSVFGNPNDAVRDTPDVSLFAADGAWGHAYIFCWSDTAHDGAACGSDPSVWSSAGGTSFASPIMAGIQALVNQKTGARQGNPNPVYYQLAAAEYGSSGSSVCNSSNGFGVSSACIFYDVTLGDMDVDCTGSNSCFLDGAAEGVLSTSNSAYQPAYGTTLGWDFATGIGTVNAANLVNNWPATSTVPTLNTISPSSGQQGQTITTVTLTGANLAGATINALSGITVSNVTSAATQVTATFTIAANAPLGAQNVSVTTPNGTSGNVSFTVNAVPVPTLGAINPASGVLNSNAGVTLTGTNFIAGATINLSGTGITVSGVTVMNSTTITATFGIAANAPLGAQSVSVTTAGGTSGTVTFTVNAVAPTPTLGSVSPASNVQGAIIGVTLTGTNFIAGAAVNVSGTGVTASGVSVVSGTTITATFTIGTNAPLGARNVSVTTAGGTSGTVTFTVNAAPGAPKLTAPPNPQNLAQGNAYLVTLTGSNFVPGNTAININHTGVSVSNVMALSSTSLTATFAISANSAVGTVSFTVSTPFGTSGTRAIDVIGVPVISSISPNNAKPGTSLTVTLSGSQFLLAQVQFSGTGITASNRSVNSNFTTITYKFTIASGATPGPQTVTLSNAAGTSNGVIFTINGSTPAPTLSAISPASGQTGQVVTPVTLSGTNLTGATINAPSGITASGVSSTATSVTATFTIAANAATGAQNVSATTAGGTSNGVTFTVNAAPTFTSANNAAFAVGTAGSFTVSTTGFPTAAITEAGSLPGPVTFVDNHNGTATLSGTPASGTAGTYNITITAANGVGSNAMQAFTLTVNQAPAITSASSATFTAGSLGSFIVSTTGFPIAAITEAGGLPSPVTFVDNHDGTATLSGTPGAGTGGTYNITITAANGVGSNAMQVFTLTVDQAPAITSAGSATFTVGSPGSFTVSTTGFPIAAITEAGGLPSPVTLVDNHNGTATLSGTPGAGTGGAYNFTISAANGVGTSAMQAFTLTVNQPPAITSANSATFTAGTAGSFTVSSNGFPAPTLTEAGALPSGVSFADNHNGTGTLSISAAASTGGTFNITFTAANGVGTSSMQAFTLTVNQAPTITSANNATFTVGTTSSFTVTYTGFPAPSLSESGALPSGVSFADNHNGTGTLSITPAATTGGTFNITFTAANGVGSNAVQPFTLTVNLPLPTLTSLTTTHAAPGINGGILLSGTNFYAPATINASGTGLTFTVSNVLSSTSIQANFAVAANAPPGPQNVTVTTPGGTSNSVTFTVDAPPPTLTSISPSSGIAGNSVPVTLTGTNFAAGASINFSGAGVTISNTVVVNSTTITATFGLAANAATGTQYVSVTASGQTSGNVTFMVNPAPPMPTLSGISPSSGVQSTAVPVTLSGTNLSGATINTPTGITASGVSSTATSVSATFTIAANAATGAQNVTVTTTSGTSNAVTFTVNPPAPMLSGISPSSGATGQVVNPVTLSGTNLTGATINTPTGVTASGVSSTASSVTATFTIAANAPTGAQNVTVTTAGGTSNAVTFTVNQAPGISSASSTTFNVGSPGAFTVTTAGSPIATITEAGGLPSAVTFVDNHDGTATLSGTPASGTAGVYALTITAANGVGSNAVQGFTLTVNAVVPPAPVLSTISPSNGMQSQVVNPVTLTGSNLSGATFSAVNGISITNVVTSASQITATFTIAGNAPVGVQNIMVTTAGGTSNGVTFTVNPGPPTLGTISPAGGNQGQMISTVTLTGTNLAGATINALNGITISNVVATATQVTATFGIAAGAPLGGQSVTVTTASGTSNGVTFTVSAPPPPPPTLTSLTTTHALPGISGAIQLTGTNFSAPATINASGTGLTFSSINVLSSTSITAGFSVAANAPPGPQNVSVTTAGGTSNAVVFTVDAPAPTLASISPSNSPQGANVNVTLTGTGFTSGASINFSGAGVTISNTAVVSSTTITATFGIAANAATGTQYVSVTTSSGTSGNVTFMVNPPLPTLTGLSPSSGLAGTAPTVTLTGTGFVAGQTSVGSSAQAILITNVVVVSATQLTATFNIASDAVKTSSQITVYTPNGTTGTQTFTIYRVPSLTSVSPNSGSRGTNVNVTLSGNFFVAPVTVNFGGAGVVVTNVTVVNVNTVTATLQISAGATTGAQNVSVTTPGGTSAVAAFTVN